MNVRVEHVGKRFGRLIVLERVIPNAGKHVRWRCACDCGGVSVVTSTHLISGHSTSCGCATREATARRNIANAKHGMWKSPEFAAWTKMIERCNPTSKKPKNRKNYVERGITVCEEWRDSFEAFFLHVGLRPSPQHSIDRTRNAEGYKPGNVRWATDVEQNNNRRSNVTAVIGGETLTAAQIAARFGITHRVAIYRIRAGKSAAEIVAKGRSNAARNALEDLGE